MRRLVLNWILPTFALSAVIFTLIRASSVFGGRGYDLGAYTSIQFVLNTNASALASTLGILMAIELLMAQLTAQRYSFSIIGMFVKNPRNVALVVLFIVTISFSLWLSASVDENYVPHMGTYLALGMGTVCFGLLIPYFAYLFETLKPHNLLNALQRETLAAVDAARRGRTTENCRTLAAEKIQQMGDITQTAVSLSDADVARHSVWILYGSLWDYLPKKTDLPVEWFSTEASHAQGRHPRAGLEMDDGSVWFEQSILEEFQSAFASSLNRLQTVNTAVALCCRLASERALQLGDEAALKLLTKFFNTLLRAALNAHDARSGYHLLYQYALLAEAGFGSHPEVTLEIARRIAYYGETAIGMGVLWTGAAAAQDLRTLAEASVTRAMPDQTTAQIQNELLGLVRHAEIKQSPALGMLQKAAMALGAFHLDRGNLGLASELARGLRGADQRELAKLMAELAGVTEPQFWELTDRAVNFDFVEERPRARLSDFVGLVTGQSSPSERSPEPLKVGD